MTTTTPEPVTPEPVTPEPTPEATSPAVVPEVAAGAVAAPEPVQSPEPAPTTEQVPSTTEPVPSVPALVDLAKVQDPESDIIGGRDITGLVADKQRAMVIKSVEVKALAEAALALGAGGPDSVHNATGWIAWGADTMTRMGHTFAPAAGASVGS